MHYKGKNPKVGGTSRYRRNTSYSRGDEPKLGEKGISVFREVNPDGPIAEPMRVFEKLTRDRVRRVRGMYIDSSTALNQLTLREVIRNSELGRVAATEAVDAVYAGVPSLRRNLVVKLGTVGIFATPGNPMVYFGIAVDQRHFGELNQERADIINTIEALAPENREDNTWLGRKIPHVTLGMIEPDDDRFVGQLKAAVRGVLPNEIQLRKATIYNPASGH